MARKKRSVPNVGAKLEAVVGVKYSRSRTTTEVIPPDVTRAKTGAWLTILSPLTEWAGLKGDELRHKRDILRLQREDVLGRIATLVKQRLPEVEGNVSPVPNKFVVPFLESASLEDPDGPLVDLWANLFVSAAKGFNSYHSHFVGIMSRLAPRQGELLKIIVETDNLHKLELATDDIGIFYESPNIRSTLETRLTKLKKKSDHFSDDDFAELILDLLTGYGIAIRHVSFENLLTEKYADVIKRDEKYLDEFEIDYSILQANGLIGYVDTGFIDVDHWSVSLSYYHLTRLGFQFVKACRIAV